MILAGDVGGTSARLALAQVQSGVVTFHRRQDYTSAEYPGLAPIVCEFIRGLDEVPSRACFGVPCPVTDGRCQVANLDWTIDLASLREETGLPGAILINDFAAIAHAIPMLGPADTFQLKPGQAVPGAPIAILGAGTGLGQGALLPHGSELTVVGSEGGHADFAPRTAEEIRFLEFLLTRLKRVSWERILSGPGIENLYRFLRETRYAPEQPEVAAELAAQDPPSVITRHALAGSDALSARALDMFAAAYGAQAGNLALVYRALGGIYLAGGIAPRILPILTRGGFHEAFASKGRLSHLLLDIPVHVITHSSVGLIGAAAAAARD